MSGSTYARVRRRDMDHKLQGPHPPSHGYNYSAILHVAPSAQVIALLAHFDRRVRSPPLSPQRGIPPIFVFSFFSLHLGFGRVHRSTGIFTDPQEFSQVHRLFIIINCKKFLRERESENKHLNPQVHRILRNLHRSTRIFPGPRVYVLIHRNSWSSGSSGFSGATGPQFLLVQRVLRISWCSGSSVPPGASGPPLFFHLLLFSALVYTPRTPRPDRFKESTFLNSFEPHVTP